jgi:uncharacterized protein
MSENRTSNSLSLKLRALPHESSQDLEVLGVHRAAVARLKATNAHVSSYLAKTQRVAASRTALLQDQEKSKQVLDDVRRRNADELDSLSSALTESLKSLGAEPVVVSNQITTIGATSAQLRAEVAEIKSEFESLFRDFIAGFDAERPRVNSICRRLRELTNADTQMRNRVALVDKQAEVEIRQSQMENAQTSWTWLVIVWALLFCIGLIKLK